jgi:prepilin-type N-terminal cleavage/methylation domain-containing protein
MNNAKASGGWFSSSRDGFFSARRNSEESGFTIIELVVSMALLAIVAAPLAGVFWSAIRTAGSAAHRTDGSSVASREIEALRAVPYGQVGFYNDQTGYTATTLDGLTTVSLGTSSPTPGPGVTSPQMQPVTPDPSAAAGFAPDPVASNANPIVLGNVVYSVWRYIGWSDAKDASTNYSQAYKKLTVIVKWRDQAGAHTVRQDSLLYPGGLGAYGGAGPLVTTTTVPAAFAPAAPLLADISPQPGPPTPNPANQTQAKLLWSQPPGGGVVTSYSVEYSTDSSFPAGNFTVVNGLGANVTLYTVPGLTPDTTYYFEIIAYSGSLSATSAAKAFHTDPLPGPTCTLGALNVAGATSLSTTGTILKNNLRMSENLTLSWTTSGPCTDTYEVHAFDPTGTVDQGSPYSLGGSGGAYSGTVPSSNQKNWAVGLHTFTVYDVSTGTTTSVVKTFKVCVNGVPSC